MGDSSPAAMERRPTGAYRRFIEDAADVLAYIFGVQIRARAEMTRNTSQPNISKLAARRKDQRARYQALGLRRQRPTVTLVI